MSNFRERVREAASRGKETWLEQQAWNALPAVEKATQRAGRAYANGDAIHQITLSVDGEVNDVLNAVAAEGWQLLTASFISDALAAARDVVGPDTGYYVFVRRP